MDELLSMFSPQTLLVRLAFLAVLVVVCIGVGADLGYRYRDNSARVAMATAVARQANADANAIATQMQAQQTEAMEYEAAVEHGNALAGELIDVQRQLNAAAQQNKRSIANVTTIYRTAPGSAVQPIPHCVFTRGWVRSYNDALGSSVPSSAAAASATVASGVANQAVTASAADGRLLESGVSSGDILAHAEDYGAWCRALSEQIDGLIDFHGRRGE